MLCSDNASLLNVSSNMNLSEGSLVKDGDSLGRIRLALLFADSVYDESMAYSVRLDSLILPVLRLFKSNTS